MEPSDLLSCSQGPVVGRILRAVNPFHIHIPSFFRNHIKIPSTPSSSKVSYFL